MHNNKTLTVKIFILLTLINIEAAIIDSSLLFAQGNQQRAVSALGRIEPEDGIVLIAAPSNSQSISGSLLATIHVKAGDYVKQGDLLAVTHSNQLLKVGLKQAQAELELAFRSAQATASQAEEACVVAKYALREAERRKGLVSRKLTSEEEAENAAGEAEAKAALCNAAQANKLVAESKIDVAKTNLEFRDAQLQQTLIKAPFNGRVLDVLIQPGEYIGTNGILELAKVDRMYAIAEVYETDIKNVKIGNRAIISSSLLTEPVTGKVEFIHLKVAKQDEINTDPAARKDARIIEVEILLDNPQVTANLTYHQVHIVIEN